jgi:reticulon-4-interacting protein 1, mitochondrial
MALQVQGPGPALRMASVRLPARGQGRVPIRVLASSINPIDEKRANGHGRRLLQLKGAGRYPLVLGNDFAGELGQAFGGLRRGQPVYGLVPMGAQGAHATALMVDPRWLRAAPEGGSPAELAALPYSFTSMFLALRAAGLDAHVSAGRQVLIHGASGALGRLALQLLVRWGARVTTVSGPQGLEDCRHMGAACVLDRHQQPFKALSPVFDATLNFGSWEDDAALVSLLSPQALGHATTVHPLLETFDQLGWLRGALRTLRLFRRQQGRARQACPSARYRWVVFQPDTAALDALHELVMSGEVRLPLGMACPLERAAEGFAHVRAGRPGRAILLPGGVA